jgi:hypothetical protein
MSPAVTSPRRSSAAQSQLSAAAAFATLACELAATSDVDEVVALVLEFAVCGVRCDSATIQLLATGQSPAITVTSDPRVTQLGPPQPVELQQKNRTRGRSVHVVELAVGWSTLGTIAFSAADAKGFSAADTGAAKLLAVHAGLAIGTAQTAVNLSAAIDSHAVVGRALGIVMERLQIDGEEAFGLLRRASQDSNVKLRDIASDVVTTRCLPCGRPRRARQRLP